MLDQLNSRPHHVEHRGNQMKLRRRSGRHSISDGRDPPDSRANELPADVLQLLAARLSVEDLARASTACKAWARELRQGITSVSLVVPNPTTPRHPPVSTLAAHSPNLQQLEVLLSGRSKHVSLHDALSNLELLQKLAGLRLTFLVSPTPKRGPWPLFFSDGLNIGRVSSLVLDGAPMPRVAVTNLLENLSASPSHHLKQLRLLTGQPPPASQLPAFKPPVYLTCGTSKLVGLSGDCLARLVKIQNLSEITIPHDPALPATGYRQLTKLKALTSLKLLGCLSGLPALQRLGQLKRLRRLTACVKLPQAPAELNAGQFQHLRELNLGLQGPAPPSSVTALLQSVAASLPVSLCGLSLQHLTLDEPLLELLAGITSLQSLELLGMQLGPAPAPAAGAGAAGGSRSGLNLSCLGQLQGIRKFRLSLSAAPAELPVAFGAPQQQQQQQQGRMERRRGSWATQQQQQPKAHDPPAWGDLSGLVRAWPGLQELQLTGLPMTSITSPWDSLQNLTGLTSLTLQLALGPAPDLAVVGTCLQQVMLEMGGPGSVLRLGQLPGALRQLQLDSVVLEVPARLPFEASLTSLSLATCLLRSQQQQDVAGSSNNNNVSSAGGSSNNSHAAPGPVTRSRRSSSNNHAAAIVTAAGSSPRTPLPRAHPKPPLAPLLQGLPRLQQLELINLPWLDDSLLAAAGAATAEACSLTGLSVIGVGVQGLTHGGLLGLTGLQKLRQLRWHVGDALELMPDVSALAQLRGLVALQIPTWLNSQMERWGAYAVLDKLPLCDVTVESVL